VRAGLRAARHDWVYLLNNDVVLEPLALCALAPHRACRTFSIASHIVLKDTTRLPDETNWTTLLVESGLALIHDRIPTSGVAAPNFYSGGGASLFQRRLLRSLLDDSAYAPFYWEDVEWGWRARKLGYESTFCPGSVAHHTRRSTVARYYSPAEVERIVRRKRFPVPVAEFHDRRVARTGDRSDCAIAGADGERLSGGRYALENRSRPPLEPPGAIHGTKRFSRGGTVQSRTAENVARALVPAVSRLVCVPQRGRLPVGEGPTRIVDG